VGLKHRYLDAQKDQLVFRHPQTRELAPETEEVFSRARRLIGEARGANRSRLAPLRACLGARPMRHARTDPPRRHADGAGSSGFRVQRLLEGARRSAGVPRRLQQVGPARGAGAPVVAAVAVDPLAETLEPPAAREVPTEGRGAQVGRLCASFAPVGASAERFLAVLSGTPGRRPTARPASRNPC